MGLPFSCPLGDFDDLDRRFEAVLVRSLSLGSGDVKTALRSLSFNGHDSKPTVLEPCSSGNLLMEGSLSYERRELETMFPFRTPTAAMENQAFTRTATVNNRDINNELPRINSYSKKDSHPELSGHGSRRYQAAIQLQKVYKSFRTRRQLADCAVLVEQRWWKLLDFAELKRSSISFFDIEKPETAISRWSRARKRAAKVGKGLSKDEKARKLALQHWLEAIDPRHRYGHNLQFYYVTWLHCESKQPFFYWLDIGEGKEANLEICPRSKLQQQCIKYLGPTERKAYEVVIKNGRFVYKPSGEVLDTRGGPRDTKWIFVLSASKALYVGQKKKGTFQHSSFLAGGATLSAGRLVVEDGILKAVWPHSGHYLPTEENFEEFMSFLKEHDVDLTNVQKSPTEEDEETVTKKGNDIGILGNKTYQEVSQDDGKTLANENADSKDVESGAERNPDKPAARLTQRLLSRIARLEIPTVGSVYDIFKTETLPTNSHDQDSHHDQDSDCASEDGYETAEDSFLSEEDFMHPKVNLFGEDGEEEAEEPIPKEKIMQRIDSHKGMKSYQLAQQLSSRWTTGAGPRISCMRDYPPELQFRVLEQAHLSPRASSANFSPGTRTCFSPTLMTPTSLHRQASAGKSPLAVDQNKKMSLKATS